MKCHNFHLRGYSVEDFGRRIEIDLVSDMTPAPREAVLIRFFEVAVYHFVLTGGAIIVNIVDESPVNILRHPDQDLAKWAAQYGLTGYEGNTEEFLEKLIQQGCRAWRIESAIGMGGFIIAGRCEYVA